MAYVFPAPGEPIEIVDSAESVSSSGQPCGPTTVRIPLRADARTRWRCEEGRDMDTKSLVMSHPLLGSLRPSAAWIPSGKAADVLAREAGCRTDTVAGFLTRHQHWPSPWRAGT